MTQDHNLDEARNEIYNSPESLEKDFLADAIQSTTPGTIGLEDLADATENTGTSYTRNDEPGIGEKYVPPADTKPAGPPKEPTESELYEKTKSFMEVRDLIQSELLAMLAKEKDPDLFKFTDEELDKITRYAMPSFKNVGGKIPEWLLWAIYETVVMKGKIQMAMNMRQVNLANEKGTKPNLSSRVIEEIKQEKEGQERRFFTVDKNGYYTYDRGPQNYLKEDERKEKAKISDLQKILADKKNKPAVLAVVFSEVFKMSNAEIEELGIKIPENE